MTKVPCESQTSDRNLAVQIRSARSADTAFFPAIERSAGLAFREIPELAWIAYGDDLPPDFHWPLVQAGTCWTAAGCDDRPIGFLSAQIFSGDLHIWELSVRLDRQRLGIGRCLLRAAIHEGRLRNLASVTLTTFRDVPWNAPFYAMHGFLELGGSELDPRLLARLQDEAKRGFPRDQRCAMRLPLQVGDEQ